MGWERRLKDPSKWLGGFCGMLASDMGWSVFWLRIVWVVMTLLSPVWGVLLYIAGSVLYPKIRS